MPEPEDTTEGEPSRDPLPIGILLDVLKARPFDAAKAQSGILRALRAGNPDDPGHLHFVLDVVLALRGLARGDSDGDEAALGREAAAVLIHGALGWTRPTRPFYAPSIEALEAEPARWRFEVSAHLSQGTDLLPEWLSKPLQDALEALHDGSGQTPRLLTQTPKQGHGLNPGYARHLERLMVCWAFYEAGRGATMEKATQAVAAAARVSPKAVEKWRAEWRNADAAELEWKKETNQARGAAGKPFRDDGGTLEEIVQQWQLARLPAKAR